MRKEETRTLNKDELKFDIVKHVYEPNLYYTTITISDEEGNYVEYTDSSYKSHSYIKRAKVCGQVLYRNDYIHDLTKLGRGRISRNAFNKLNELLQRIDKLYGDTSFNGFENIGSIQTGVILTYGFCGVKHKRGEV